MNSPEAVEIRSYRTVFDLERRIYRIDRLRLNPSGIPVRGVLYFLLALLFMLLLGVLPVTGLVVGLFPWYMRDLAAPLLVAALLGVIRVEGRPFHLAAISLARYAAGPRHFSGLRPCEPLGRRWHPSDLLFLPDGSDSRLRSMRFTGPGVALISVAHERAMWQSTLTRRTPHLTLRALSHPRTLAKGQVIELRRGVCLHVHGAPPTQVRLRGGAGLRSKPHDARSHSSQSRATRPGRGCIDQTARTSGRRTRWKYE